jgi:hypothetical protein
VIICILEDSSTRMDRIATVMTQYDGAKYAIGTSIGKAESDATCGRARYWMKKTFPVVTRSIYAYLDSYDNLWWLYSPWCAYWCDDCIVMVEMIFRMLSELAQIHCQYVSTIRTGFIYMPDPNVVLPISTSLDR